MILEAPKSFLTRVIPYQQLLACDRSETLTYQILLVTTVQPLRKIASKLQSSSQIGIVEQRFESTKGPLKIEGRWFTLKEDERRPIWFQYVFATNFFEIPFLIANFNRLFIILLLIDQIMLRSLEPLSLRVVCSRSCLGSKVAQTSSDCLIRCGFFLFLTLKCTSINLQF